MKKLILIILSGMILMSTTMTTLAAEVPITPTVVGEPVQYMELSNDQRYEINTFLSNFIQRSYNSGDSNYFDIAAPNLSWMVSYCYGYSCFKMDYRPESKDFPDKEWRYYREYPLEEFNKSSEYLFGRTFTDEEIKANYITSENGQFYQDSNFYFAAADGAQLDTFAIADNMYIDSNGNQVVDFSIYELSSKAFWVEGKVPSYYYSTTSEEIKQFYSYAASKVATGRAVVVPAQYHWRDIYYLKAYYDTGV